MSVHPPLPPDVVAAPAKLTRSLRITGVRPDGLHLIDAEMVSLDLVDELALRPEVGRGDLEVRDAATAKPLDVGPPERNLVRRALRLLAEHDPTLRRPVDVVLSKRIPAGAGLGGGSSDAAAVLRWGGWTGTPHELERAAELGADVPFCLVGGRARVRGIGEIVERLPFEPLELTLLLPPFGCSTPAVYRAWDELGGPRAEGPNDLEPAALVVEPRLVAWRDRLGDATGRTPSLAGSGSTWFVEGSFPGDDRVVVHTIAPFG